MLHSGEESTKQGLQTHTSTATMIINNNNNNSRLNIQTDMYTVRLFDIVVTDDQHLQH